MRANYYGSITHRTFNEIWETSTAFLYEYKNSGIYSVSGANRLDDEKSALLYYLLNAKYGNNYIASNDEAKFKNNVFSIIYSYGPTWVRKTEVQDELRSLSESDLMKGSKSIFNRALNPGTEPSTATLEELTAINEQNTSNTTRGKMEAYTLLYGILSADITEEFLNRFGKLFMQAFVPIPFTEEEDPEPEPEPPTPPTPPTPGGQLNKPSIIGFVKAVVTFNIDDAATKARFWLDGIYLNERNV